MDGRIGERAGERSDPTTNDWPSFQSDSDGVVGVGAAGDCDYVGVADANGAGGADVVDVVDVASSEDGGDDDLRALRALLDDDLLLPVRDVHSHS